MTKKLHPLRNHKNLRLIIPDNKSSSVVVQQTIRHRDSQAGVDTGDTKEIINRTNKTETKEKEENPDNSVPFFKLFQFSTTLEKVLMWIGVLCATVSGLTSPAGIYIFGDLVGSMVKAEMMNAIEHGNTSVPPVENVSTDIMDAVTEFAIGNSVLGIVLAVFTYFSVMLFNYTTLKQSFRIRTLYFRSVLHQDIAWYDLTRSGEVSSRLTEDVIKFEDGIGEKVVMLVHNVVGFAGCLGLGLYSGWLLTLVCLGSVPVMLVVLLFVVRVSQTYSKRAAEVYARASAVAEEAISGIRTVVAFAGQHRELQRYTDELQHTYRNNVRQGLLSAIGLGLLWLTIYSSYALAFWYGVKLILDDRHLPLDQQTYNPQTMIKVFFSVMMGAMNLGACSPFIEAFGTSKASASKVFSVIKRKPAIDSLADLGHTATDVEGSIEFKNVTFEYPSRTGVKVLKNLSFTVNKGETVALVGNSGCGKSTCIQLLQRFYDPTEGQIFIDGHDLTDLNIKLLRNCFGVVGQEPVLFDTTVAENIRFGDSDALTEKIVHAAKEANAHDFIKKLPYKYDTLVGEKGAQLSGGQKQRIAIARALIRNPKIILLDEATSALDTRSESKVQAALDKAHKGRTTIIVAHRLSTIKGADKVIVISDGKVVEEGNHDDLMKLKGHYYSLVTSQVSQFSKPIGENKNQVDEPDDDEELESNLKKPEIEDKDKSKEPEVSFMRIARLNSKEWPFNVLACVTSILFGFSTPLFSIIFGDIIGSLSKPDTDEVLKETNMYSIYFIIIGIVTGLSSFIQVFVFRVSGERLTLRLRGLLFGAMLRQEMGWFDEPANGTGALCAKLSTEAAAVQGAIGQRIGTIVQSCSTIVLSIGLAIYYDWRLGLVGTGFVPLLLLVTYAQGIVYVNETLNYHKSLESSTKIAVEAVSNIRTVIGLCREDTFYNSYVTAMKPSLTLALRNTHFRGLVFGMARSCNMFAYAACMFYGGYLIQNEGLFYGNVFKVSQALILGTTMVANALAFSPNLQKGLVAAGQIIKLIERKTKIQDPETLTEDNWVSKAAVEYKKVTFKYPLRPETKVLKELEFKVDSGTTIALIGSSGCGKSTVIQLLQRFYDLDSGAIEVSETDIRSVTQSALRKQLGLVSQEPRLFARSIAENIGYGDNERQVQMQDIIAAAKKANIHEFVASLPHGYDTKLGDRGTQLSGGQKQRVAIARALVRDPKILLLDEATSALDSESEKIVQAALDKAKAGRTCIMIAHRLSTVVDADKICVMHRGIIVESGTHSELVEKKGVYYGLLC